MKIRDDFFDYLTNSGYNLYRSERSRHFTNAGKYLLMFDDGDMHFTIDGHSICMYKNVNYMSLFTFALLLHAIGAVDMKKNFRKTREVEI